MLLLVKDCALKNKLTKYIYNVYLHAKFVPKITNTSSKQQLIRKKVQLIQTMKSKINTENNQSTQTLTPIDLSIRTNLPAGGPVYQLLYGSIFRSL